MLQFLKVAVARLYSSEAHVRPIYPRLNGDPIRQDSVPPIFRVPFHGFNSLDLYEVTVNKLQQLLSDGRLTSVEYINFCLERIHKVSLPQRSNDLRLHRGTKSVRLIVISRQSSNSTRMR